MVRPRTLTPDRSAREAAVRERARNVLIDAGAGTGKTTILVDRLVEMVAPTDDVPAVPIGRIAAITFTRKAAGELRLRIRERLLADLADSNVPAARAARLREAVAGLDTAHVGTIHSFADRLLRLRPVEARLSPSYEIADDTGELVAETVDVLFHAAQNGTLAAELEGTPAADRAEEATRTILFALAAGVRATPRETEYHVFYGLSDLVAGFIAARDVPPPDALPAAFDAEAFRAAADELWQRGRVLAGGSMGARALRQLAETAGRLRSSTDPWLILRELRPRLERVRRDWKLNREYENDQAAWDVWKLFDSPGKKRSQRRVRPLRDDLCGPLDRWLATRLVRLFPVAVALYEKVKARHQQLDQIDLLVKLRDLLASNRQVRTELQRLFDHVFVDEFQDTDPLQAEIILYLCERGARAARWSEVELRPGSLTLVGDPKQSIYRFRRADVAMYDQVRGIIASQDALSVTLSSNFRSRPSLIRWLNDRFERILGRSPAGRPFDAATGRVFQQALHPGRDGDSAPAVHVLPLVLSEGEPQVAERYRALEGKALARYLRWLVDESGVEITDPVDRRRRPVAFGDIAVLAVSTWSLPLLFQWLDEDDVPYASRGGRLFLTDPLTRQFLLGLRALADPDDGVAEAALLRPPFFALDPADLLLERAARTGAAVPAEVVARVEEARALVRELRRGRLDRSPGAVARDLLDRTAFARDVATGPNGAQRLRRLRELCLVLGQMAATEGLDYDAATARMRDWALNPIELDPPHPVGGDALQVLTVHQAKGLEFPVVVLWDARLQWDTRLDHAPWRMARDERGWVVNLDGVVWEEPAGQALRETEKAYLDAERRRVVYVAATRARDLLVVPAAGLQDPKIVCSALVEGADPALVRVLAPYKSGREPRWASRAPRRAPEPRVDPTVLERSVDERWRAATVDAARPRFRPVAVSDASSEPLENGEATTPPGRAPSAGRLGATFGTAVHRAIGLALRGSSVAEAVRTAAAATGLTEHLAEAMEDVERSLAALRAEGLLRPLGPDLQIEYPLFGPGDGGLLLSGFIDLVSVTPSRVDVIDFKTDAPPEGDVAAAYAGYVAQVRAYGRLLALAGCAGPRPVRTGLLFSATGRVHWV